jgi:hypothetical protein
MVVDARGNTVKGYVVEKRQHVSAVMNAVF